MTWWCVASATPRGVPTISRNGSMTTTDPHNPMFRTAYLRFDAWLMACDPPFISPITGPDDAPASQPPHPRYDEAKAHFTAMNDAWAAGDFTTFRRAIRAIKKIGETT